MNKAEAVAILVLLLLALFLRELDVDRPLYGDEADWYKSALILVNGNQQWTNTYISDSPPLGKAIFVSFYAIGFENMRQVTVLFAMASLIVTYLLARDFLGKRSALLALIVLATSAYAIIGAQHVDRDGGMLAFFAMLVFYGYLKYAYAGTRNWMNKWLGLSLLAFLAASLCRTNMVVLALPILAFEYVRVGGNQRPMQRLAKGIKALAPFALAFILSFGAWLVLDGLMQMQTMSKTFAHYFTYATGSNQDLNSRILRTVVSVARVLARLGPAMALALAVAAYGLWQGRKRMNAKEAGLLAMLFAWISIGALSVLLVTQGNVPAYFAPIIPAIAIVVGHFCTGAEVKGWKWFAFALVFAIAYAGLLGYLDFNEVNLLLLPAAGIGAFVLALVYWLFDRNLARLAVVLLALGMASSAFMLDGLRTYDAMRSQAVADAADYFDMVGAQKIAESQERTLDLYVEGTVRQYTEQGTCAMVDGRPCPADEVASFPAGFYVVNFPLKPLALDPAVGAQFRFNLFYEKGVENCKLERIYKAHNIVLSEIYRC